MSLTRFSFISIALSIVPIVNPYHGNQTALVEVVATMTGDQWKIYKSGYGTFLVRRFDVVWEFVNSHSSSRLVSSETSKGWPNSLRKRIIIS